MNEPFYNLYNIIFDTGSITNKKLQKHIFTELGNNDPRLLVDTSDIPHVFDRLTYQKLIFHDQEPILFNSFKNAWLNKIHFVNRLETNHILSNSEKNSIEKDELLKQSGWHDFYWFSNGFLSLEWYRFYRYAKYLENCWNPTKNFSSYNRILPDRLHRLEIANHLYNHYPNQIILSRHFGDDATDNLFVNTTNIKSKNLSYTIHDKDFIDSFCHVITERIFYEDRIHLTEKTFRPIICCRPFILASSPGSLQYLKDYGFKTFSDFWSEDYDNITDHNKRLYAILNIIDYIGSLTHSQMIDLLHSMKEILIYNRNHFYNQFEKNITKELHDNLHTALLQQNNVEPYYNRIMQSLTPAEYELVKNSTEMCTEFDDYVPISYLQAIDCLVDQKPSSNIIRPFVTDNLKYLNGFYTGTVHVNLQQA
jgi:hypothetical protein